MTITTYTLPSPRAIMKTNIINEIVTIKKKKWTK